MDRYTQFVLTAIALALWVVALQNFGFLTARADNGSVARVEICGKSDSGKLDCAAVQDNLLLTRAYVPK